MSLSFLSFFVFHLKTEIKEKAWKRLETLSKVKRQATDREERFSMYITENESVSRIYNKFLQVN